MPTVGEFQEQVRMTEGVRIRLINDKTGRDIRDDKQIATAYDVDESMSGESSVSDLIYKLKRDFVALEVGIEVIHNGEKAHGKTKLKNIRNKRSQTG